MVANETRKIKKKKAARAAFEGAEETVESSTIGSTIVAKHRKQKRSSRTTERQLAPPASVEQEQEHTVCPLPKKRGRKSTPACTDGSRIVKLRPSGRMQPRGANHSTNTSMGIQPFSLEDIQGLISDKELYTLTEEQLRAKMNGWKQDGVDPRLRKYIHKRYQRRNQRREERIQRRNVNKVCFLCRQPGHILSECPRTDGDPGSAVSICFKCGEADHTSSQCRLKIKEFPFAKCFICNEMGHLSRQCTQNEHGVFPHGGSCNLCGAIDHMKKDCPRIIASANDEGADGDGPLVASRPLGKSLTASMDDEDRIPTQKKKKKAKIIKF